MNRQNRTLSILLATALFGGCAATQPGAPGTERQDEYEKTKQGAALGAALGAIAGALVGGKNKGRAALIGASLGATAGAGIGYSLDQQAKDVAESLDTTVSDSDISSENIVVTKHDTFVKVTFKSAMMFETDVDVPTPSARSKIDELSAALRKYPGSIIQVAGHTDSRGTHAYNLGLSERRAHNVAAEMLDRGLQNTIYARGCSYDKPLVPNTGAANMAQNRRVEVFLYQKTDDIIDPCI